MGSMLSTCSESCRDMNNVADPSSVEQRLPKEKREDSGEGIQTYMIEPSLPCNTYDG